MTNAPWGDTLNLTKPEGTFCLYGLNPNGFRIDKQGGNITKFFYMASSIDADFVGCSEHNLNFTQFRVQDTAYKAIRNTVEHSKAVWYTTPTPFENTYKPGGTMSCILGNGVARVKKTGSDDLGRWIYIKLAGKDGRVITIVTVYQICNQPTTGLNRDKCPAHAQQLSLLIQCHKQDPSPIKHFRKDLHQFLQSCTKKNELLMLYGDFNEVLGSQSNGVSKLARDFDLVDVMHAFHQIPGPATYARGRDRLDYILASPDVYHSITACGYDPFNERFFSDHRGYFVDMNIDQLFGNELHHLEALPFHDVRGQDTKSVTGFVEAKDKYLEEHEFYPRIQRLRDLQQADPAFAESLDGQESTTS
jgi:hypothetical protein